MVGAALHALGQQALGALGVTGAEAGLEEGVVEDVALGPAPPDLGDPRSERIDALDRLSVVPARERLRSLGQRHDDPADQTALVLGPPLPNHFDRPARLPPCP